MGADRQEEEHLEADPIMASPSTNIAESSSLARASADDHVRTKDTPTSEAAGSQAKTTEVVGEENISSEQDQIGNPLCF
jgi:hypothetical protein